MNKQTNIFQHFLLNKILQHKAIRYAMPFIFLAFICWVIYDADKGNYNVFIEFGRILPHSDKFFHALLYGLLAYFTNMALDLKRVKIKRFNILLGALIVTVFALGEEITQIPIATRNFDLLDIMSDLIGIYGFSYLAVQQFKARGKKSE